MTYNNNFTLQRRFVTSRLTLAILLSGALLLWVVFAILDENRGADVKALMFLPEWVRTGLSFVVYIAAAFITNSFVVIEDRAPWIGGLLMWLTAVCFFVQESLFLPLSLLALLIVLTLALSCYRRPNVQLWVYSTFALFSLLALFVPCSVYLFPIFFVYMALTEVFCIRNILAALLGVLTPLWMLYCLSFIIDSTGLFLVISLQKIGAVMQLSLLQPTLPSLLLLTTEALIMFPCAVAFARSGSPAKPLMRKMLTFFIMMGIFLWLITFVRSSDFSLLLVWRLPALSIMTAYLFTLKINRFTNICFIIINTLFIAIAALGIWSLI